MPHAQFLPMHVRADPHWNKYLGEVEAAYMPFYHICISLGEGGLTGFDCI